MGRTKTYELLQAGGFPAGSPASARSAWCPPSSYSPCNLSHQTEHRLFPDLLGNRYVQIAPRIRALCERFELPYTSGSLARQTGSVYKRGNPADPNRSHHQCRISRRSSEARYVDPPTSVLE